MFTLSICTRVVGFQPGSTLKYNVFSIRDGRSPIRVRIRDRVEVRVHTEGKRETNGEVAIKSNESSSGVLKGLVEGRHSV